MSAIPAPQHSAEEWADADFDIPDDHPIAGNDEDWDAPAIVRPPIHVEDDQEDDDEGVSTIKVNMATLKQHQPVLVSAPNDQDDDFEDGFALPDDLTQLSLAPLSLSHRASKNSLESWGDKDQTSSSQSSDAYSTLGLADGSSTNSATSASLPGSETDEDDEEDDLDGLVIPSGMFEKGDGAKHLKKALELRQKETPADTDVTSPRVDQEDDFEKDLIIEDVDLSPSRLLHGTQQHQSRRTMFARSNSMPIHQSSTAHRPPSRLLKSERAKSPNNPPPSASSRQLQKIRLSPSPPLHRPSSRTQNFQALSPAPTGSTFFQGKSSSLRGQKSHSGLKPPSPPSSARQLRRKASLSSLMESSSQASIAPPPAAPAKVARYEEPTAASRAKHKSSTSRLTSVEYKVPPTRPSTPSSNPAALRLTLPTQSRHTKSRPALATVFGTTASGSHSRTNSPLPPRPPSSSSSRPTRPVPTSQSSVPVPKVLRRPKRQRTFGDGTELDGFDDLPTDREKEGRYRVQPKDFGNRVPGGTYSSNKSDNKGTLRRKNRRESSSGGPVPAAFASSTNLRAAFKPDSSPAKSSPSKKKRNNAGHHTKRKPTLIRNLGGAGAEKVVGGMKWNPHTLRWEGNEQVLRDFDAAVGTSTRPALITHLTGSSIGSPATTFASGARIVGNMMFDPSRMCWISTLPPDEEEPDVFANLADDEDDQASWERKGGTIRGSHQPSDDGMSRSPNSSTSSSSVIQGGRSRAVSVSGSDRGSRASLAFDIDESFVEACRQAAVRHRQEMKGWRSTLNSRRYPSRPPEPDRTNLYEIRAIARRNYED